MVGAPRTISAKCLSKYDQYMVCTGENMVKYGL